MTRRRRLLLRIVTISFTLILVACGTTTESTPTATVAPPDPTVTMAPPTATMAPPTATATTAPSPTETSTPPPAGEEAILILEPGPGSRVTGPVHVAGEADPTFEQSLVVRIVDLDGNELAVEPTIIDADLGQRGPFAVDVPITVTGEQQAFIQVVATSARDGGITHLSSVGVLLAPEGPEEIVAATPHPEQITIFTPANGDPVSGGTVHVEGFGLASFEATLVVDVLDADGNVVGSEPILVQQPDLGQPGPFSADVAYSVAESGPGRVVVRDPSPAFGGDTHLASVEITLEP